MRPVRLENPRRAAARAAYAYDAGAINPIDEQLAHWVERLDAAWNDLMSQVESDQVGLGRAVDRGFRFGTFFDAFIRWKRWLANEGQSWVSRNFWPGFVYKQGADFEDEYERWRLDARSFGLALQASPIEPPPKPPEDAPGVGSLGWRPWVFGGMAIAGIAAAAYAAHEARLWHRLIALGE